MKFSPENKIIKAMFLSYPIMSIPNFQRESIAGMSITIDNFLWI